MAAKKRAILDVDAKIPAARLLEDPGADAVWHDPKADSRQCMGFCCTPPTAICSVQSGAGHPNSK